MRKKNFTYYVDTLFWNILYMLPIFILLIFTWSSGSIVGISSVFSSLGLEIFNDNIVVTTLSDIFGSGGILPIFTSNDMIIFLSYFIYMNILHLVVDVLVWLPRLAHHWLDGFSKKDI